MSCGAKMRGARKMGYLSKRGGRIHTWHKRWFVLTGDLLFYYKTPQDSRPTGTIPLVSNKVIRHPDDPKQPSSFRFEIVSGNAGQVITGNHESYLISADSAETANSWVSAIRRVMHEPFGGGMFGRSLEETMQVEARLGGSFIPILVHRCVRYIREHGMNEVGIFRLPGQAKRIRTLKEQYDAGSQEEFPPSEDVHTVASLLKLYLKELPEPVVPFALYTSCTDAVKLFEANPVEGVEGIKRLLLQLPKVNFNVLKYICRFLHEVQEYSEQNKMNIVNLGTIFGPHLLRPNTENPHVLMECNHASTDFVTDLLTKLTDFFPLTVDEKPPNRLSVVVPAGEEPPWADAPKSIKVLQQRSLYTTKSKGRSFRPRQNSAPPEHQQKRKSGSKNKVMSMVEQFNLRSSKSNGRNSARDIKITAPVITPPKCVSNGHTPSQSPPPPETTWKNSPLYRSFDSDEDVPEMIKRFSDGAVATGKFRSDTLSSDIIVNSISTELEGLEQQLAVAREEVQQFKKAARLWKRRYEQEHRARVASEQQIRELQRLIDDTFQQFALDDSEDDFEDGDSSSSLGGVADSTFSLFSHDRDTLTSIGTVSMSVTSLKDDVIANSDDVITPLTGSACLAPGHANSRPARHSFA